MKKYIFLLAIAIVAVLSSCSNDDITISNQITFKVNPITVVDNLYEQKVGDLTSLSSDSKLIVSLFIYDGNGILIDKVSNEYSSYTHMMTADVYLPSGKNYTAVATSHVASTVDYWTFNEVDQLSTFKIKDEGRIGGKNKILGLTVMNFTVNNSSETVNIDIKNAGAVAWVRFKDWNKYTNVSTYALLGKQSCDYVSFDNQGNNDYSLRSESTYEFYKIKFDYDRNYSGANGYFFTFPIKNASFRFYAITTDNKQVPLSGEFVDNVNVGESYVFLYDFETEEGHWIDMTKSRTRSEINSAISENTEQERINRIVYDYEGKSISIN